VARSFLKRILQESCSGTPRIHGWRRRQLRLETLLLEVLIGRRAGYRCTAIQGFSGGGHLAHQCGDLCDSPVPDFNREPVAPIEGDAAPVAADAPPDAAHADSFAGGRHSSTGGVHSSAEGVPPRPERM
jgi:hypothetical protein